MLKDQKWLRITVITVIIAALTFIYSTRLSMKMVAVGHDFLFHFGQVFALQTALGFEHNSIFSLTIEPIIFNNLGYGTRLFYPPLPHILPALLSLALSTMGINSLLATFRIFTWLCMTAAGLSMFFCASKILQRQSAGFLAALLYLSAPYFLSNFFLRNAYGEILSFIWLPIIILSIYYFYQTNYKNFLLAFIPGFTLIIYSHTLSTLYTAIMFGLAILFYLPRFYNSIQAWKTLFLAGTFCLLLGSPVWIPLLEQPAHSNYVIFDETQMGYTDNQVITETAPLSEIATLGFDQADPASPTTVLGGWMILSMILTVIFYPPIKKQLNYPIFYCALISIATLFLILTVWPTVWSILPHFMLTIQFPWRLHLFITPIICLLAALPLLLWNQSSTKTAVFLTVIVSLLGMHTFWYLSSYKLIEFDTIDYVSIAPGAAQGWNHEHLPTKALLHYDELSQERGEEIIVSSPSAAIATVSLNQPPRLEFTIANNEQATTIELPRLYYYGYQLQEINHPDIPIALTEGERGLMVATISGNGNFMLTYPRSPLHRLSFIAAVVTFLVAISYITLISLSLSAPHNN